MADDPYDPALRPAPPGVALRRAGWEDVARVAALYRTCELDRVGEVSVRDEDVRHRWLGLDGPGDDTLLVEDPDGTLVAYAEFHEDADPWTDALDLYVEGRVHPDHQGRGLATFLLQRAEDRARRAVARSGIDDAVLRTTVVDGDDRALTWFARRGFHPVRHFLRMGLDLQAPPPDPVAPAGIRIVAVDRGDLALAWDVHQRAFADLPTSEPAPFPAWREARVDRDPGFDPSLWWLAVHGEDPVGVCLARAGTPEAPEVGDVRDLGVVPAWRRRGVAMALLRTALRAFHARGLTGAALEVDDVTLEGAVALYRAAGMRVSRRTDVLELALPATDQAGGVPGTGT